MAPPPTNPLAGGSTFINQSPIADPKTGMATPIFTKWFNDATARLSSALNSLGQFAGLISSNARIAGRVEPIGTTVQNLNATGQIAAAAVHGTLAPAQLPIASVGAIGAVKASNVVADEWVDSIGIGGVPHTSRPGFGNLLGQATPAQVPNLDLLNGAVTAAQVPNLSALNGQITAAQLPASGLTVVITTAKLTGGGANGSMTFTNGILTAQVQAT